MVLSVFAIYGAFKVHGETLEGLSALIKKNKITADRYLIMLVFGCHDYPLTSIPSYLPGTSMLVLVSFTAHVFHTLD